MTVLKLIKKEGSITIDVYIKSTGGTKIVIIIFTPYCLGIRIGIPTS